MTDVKPPFDFTPFEPECIKGLSERHLRIELGRDDISVYEFTQALEALRYWLPPRVTAEPVFDKNELYVDIKMSTQEPLDLGTVKDLFTYVQPAVLALATAEITYHGTAAKVTLRMETPYPDQQRFVERLKALPRISMVTLEPHPATRMRYKITFMASGMTPGNQLERMMELTHSLDIGLLHSGSPDSSVR